MMNKNISLNSRCIIASLFAVVAVFQSCSKKETFDVTGDTENRIFINSEGRSSLVNLKNSFTYTIQHTVESSTSNADILAKFPVQSTKPVSSAVTVNAEIDNSLVTAYNAANNVSYEQLPSGVVTLTKMSATIEQGSSISSDQILVSVDPSKFAELTAAAYLLPVKLSSISNNSAKISTNYQTAYIVINTKEVLVKPNVPASGMFGALVTNYSTWGITASGTPTTGTTLAQMFDNNVATRWGFAVHPLTLNVDMMETKTIGGFRLFAYRAATGFLFSNVVVSVSDDGVNYKELGTGTNTTMTNASGYQYIGLYKTVRARYFRLVVTWSSTSQRGISELGVYVQ
ncbi:F5/8 type C domain protein [compost metagenome]